MGKDLSIPILAVILLLVGITSSAYVYANQIDNQSLRNFDINIILINDQEFIIEDLFSSFEIREIDSLDETGIALDYLITSFDIDCPSCHSYKIIGDDGYSQTVNWDNLKNGVLTYDKLVVFSDLPKSFNVKNVVEIEVI